jgi:hypothetical protein
MNQYLYTFSGGNLYRHNTNEVRNNFYGVQYNSSIQSVFNDEPIVNKIFKTLQYEGNRAWAATLASDQQDTGFMDANYFEKKEGDFFAFVRNSGTNPADLDEYALRSLNGIGKSASQAAGVVDFALTTGIGSILSVGDGFYFSEPPYTDISFAGQVDSITINLPAGINQVVHDNTGATPTIQNPLWLGIKNQVTDAVELFVARSEVMKSYPG